MPGRSCRALQFSGTLSRIRTSSSGTATSSGPAGFSPVQYGGDFGVLVGALNKRQGEAGYRDYLDANGDGVIDALDLEGYRIDVVQSILR